MIWVILYVIIGIICGLGYYTYECWRYSKNISNLGTWNHYSMKQEILETVTLTICLWPLVSFACIVIYGSQLVTTKIREYFGIK